MECPICHSVYQKEKNIPLLLINCGHTLCDVCATQIFASGTIICTECKTESHAESVATLPKNLALITMSNTTVSANPIPTKPTIIVDSEAKCQAHLKKLEAFCEDDRVLLCIDCILLDGHKNHDISPIPQSSEKERNKLQESYQSACNLEEKLTLLSSEISNFRADLTEKANQHREKITTMFRDITNVIHERESTLKQNVSSILEKQEDVLKENMVQIHDQLKSIEVFKSEVKQMLNENDCTLLRASKERQVKSELANQEAPEVCFAVSFPEIKKENELSAIWKTLNPQMAKTPSSNLYATTASYANKRADRSKIGSKAHPDLQSQNPVQKPTKEKLKKNDAGSLIEKALSPRQEKSIQNIKVEANLPCRKKAALNASNLMSHNSQMEKKGNNDDTGSSSKETVNSQQITAMLNSELIISKPPSTAQTDMYS
jgi:hypothetical protein